MAALPEPDTGDEPERELADANDPLLQSLLRCKGDIARETEIARLIGDVAAPLLDGILTRYGRRSVLLRQDAGDIAAVVQLRLLLKLRDLSSSADEAVRDFERYVAGLTYNAINDHLRAAFPARARLKNRIRYILMRDPRLALWNARGELVAGVSRFDGLAHVSDAAIVPDEITVPMLDTARPADALAAILQAIDAPVLLETLVDTAARLWGVTDTRVAIAELADDPRATAPSRADERNYLHALWQELQALRPMQRKALLLNLRAAESVNVIALLIHTGVASFGAVAEALERTVNELEALWPDLPLDDTAIAKLLGITRQQVINLRKSARERLSRRMSR